MPKICPGTLSSRKSRKSRLSFVSFSSIWSSDATKTWTPRETSETWRERAVKQQDVRWISTERDERCSPVFPVSPFSPGAPGFLGTHGSLSPTGSKQRMVRLRIRDSKTTGSHRYNWAFKEEYGPESQTFRGSLDLKLTIKLYL